MTAERNAFETAIRQDPWDTVTRLIYSDWLDDHDCPEEAESQRKWVTSHLWMREFVKVHHTYAKYHKPPYEKEENITEEDVREWYGEFLLFLEVHIKENAYLNFDTPRDFDSYSEEMWDHYETLTGKESPQGDNRHKQPWISCGC